MMPNITRGARMSGLLSYLQGPGKANEHTNPHIVGGDEVVLSRFGSGALTREQALAVAKVIDTPRRAMGTTVAMVDRRRAQAQADETGGPLAVALREHTRDVNVWHCSLSLKAVEGQLSDEKWGQIAGDFMDRMGFTDAGGKAPARWVAVRHGVSAAGNDHIHIAASAVREDGTKVSTFKDRKRAQDVCGELERLYGLEVLESRGAQRGERGFDPAEKHIAQRRGRGELERRELARKVRAAAASAAGEAEFVRTARGMGLLVRPRFARGGRDEVIGYSAALRPARAGDAPTWFGGGHLDKDLTLPRLRRNWADTDPERRAAAAEWAGPAAGGESVGRGRFDPLAVEQAGQALGEWTAYLRTIPVTDRGEWARAAGQSAGVLAAWSATLEPTPGPLARAADQLSRSAQIPAHQATAKPVAAPSIGMAAAALLASSSKVGNSVASTLVLRQMITMMDAVRDAHAAAGDAQRAAALEAAARDDLMVLYQRLAPPQAGQGKPSGTGVAVLERPAAPAQATEAVAAEGPQPSAPTVAPATGADLDPEIAALRRLMAHSDGIVDDEHPPRPAESGSAGTAEPALDPELVALRELSERSFATDPRDAVRGQPGTSPQASPTRQPPGRGRGHGAER